MPTRLDIRFLLLLLITSAKKSISIPIDNGVEFEPQIVCGSGFISATFLLKNNFEGHVYVKNHYNDSRCRSDQTGRRTASITVSFSTCGVQRTRSLNPKGIFVNTIIVISFHPKFITKVDRAYAFQCFYMESEKTVAAGLDVSEMTSVMQTQRVPMPVCRYEILDAQPPNGQPIRYAIVGQRVFHAWTCETETTNTFCMNVNSCYVYDGSGEQAQLLDTNGCAVDRYLLQNLEYTSDMGAFREAHVFKFADRNAIYFQCQISITIREPNSICPRPACATVITGEPPGYRPGDGTVEYNVNLGNGYDGRGTTVPRTTHYTVPPYYGSTVVPVPPYYGTTAGPYGLHVTPPPLHNYPIGDDPVNVNENPQNHSSTPNKRRKAHRHHRSAQNLSRPEQLNGEGQELGVWDVRAPSLAVFDLDDNAAIGLKLNKSRLNRSGMLNMENNAVNHHPEHCLPMYLLSLLFAMSISPTLALITVWIVRFMKRKLRMR